jgi:hypothetical protein
MRRVGGVSANVNGGLGRGLGWEFYRDLQEVLGDNGAVTTICSHDPA